MTTNTRIPTSDPTTMAPFDSFGTGDQTTTPDLAPDANSKASQISRTASLISATPIQMSSSTPNANAAADAGAAAAGRRRPRRG